MKLKVFSISILSVLSLSIGGIVLANFFNNNVEEVEAYTASSVPTTIDLNATTDDTIRDYYSDLTSLPSSERTGNNLLKNLKPILKNGQKYYSYDSGSNIWKMYEISDRDWEKSPANEITGYNSTTNIITKYTYGSSLSNKGSNPYIHALYNNRNVDNQARAWDSHGTRSDAWTIEREHVWPKSQGFKSDGEGGARGDPMHLMAAEGSANGDHSDHPYGFVDKTKKYTDTGSTHLNATGNLLGISKTKGSGTVFEPQDSDKGDIARAILYMAARYNYLANDSDTIDQNNPNLELVDYAVELSSYDSSKSVTGKMGIVSDLLEWNRLDPPDEYEIHRNDLLYTNYTNNRNPFIDFPDWAEYIWGDKKNISYANPNSDTIHDFSDGSSQQEEILVTGISLLASTTIKVGETIVLTPEITPNNATNKNVTWHNSNNSVASVSGGRVTGLTAGVTTVTAVAEDGQYEAPCEVTVVEEQTPDVIRDTLTQNLIEGVTNNVYKSWTSTITGESGAIYNGVTATTYSAIQLNSNVDKGAGIITESSTSNIRRVAVNWNSNTQANRTLVVYGKNTAYSSTAELYSDDADVRGTTLGVLVNGLSTEINVTGNYKYIGIVADNALYLDSIILDWDIPVSSVSLDNESVQLDLNGDTIATLNAEVLPDNASNKDVSWTTSNANVVTVDNGVITAKAVGEATITVTTADGSKTATCNVKVIDSTPLPAGDVTIEKSIFEIATENNWSDAVPFATSEATAVSLDENVSFYTTGTGNNGKYYSGGKNWRLYRANSGNIIVKASNGYLIKSIILTFTNADQGILLDAEDNVLSSGTSYDVNAESVEYRVSGEGETKGQIRINSIAVTYGVETPPITLSSISVSGQTTSFTKGDTFSFGGTVTATYSDNSTKNVTGSASFTGYDMQETGTQTVTVSYTEDEVAKTTTYQITVNEPQPVVTLCSIAVTTLPTKTNYTVGETFDSAGLVVTATYSDGSTKVVTDYTLSTPDMSTVGEKTITVTYQEVTTTFKISVNKTLSSISVSGQTTSFTKGDTFSFGGTVTATYSDNSTKDVTSSAEFSGYNMQEAGTQTVTVKYVENGVTKTTTYQITVNEPQPVVTLRSISIISTPTKTNYQVGEELDTSGLIVFAIYSDGSTREVTDYTLSGYDKNKIGVQVITVTYQNLTAAFTVTVADALQQQKDAAIKELNDYYNSLNLSNYTAENLRSLLAELRSGEAAIRAATSVEGINSALADAKAKMAAIPQKEQGGTTGASCGGNIAATSVVLSAIALTGAALLIYKKKKIK